MFFEPIHQLLTENPTNALPLLKPYPSITDRAGWDALPDGLKQEVLMLGEHFLHFDYPILKAADYMAFLRTGNRISFEELYFTRRRAINALVLAECVENKGRFLDDICNGILLLCEESGWQIPAHNSYVRDQTQIILPDSSRPVLDLFACETGAQLAVIAYLLKEPLNNLTPILFKRIFSELDSRIITPYLTNHFWWMGKGNETMCNWTIWCTQNVLLTANLLPFSEEIRKKVLPKACQSVDYYLKDYGEDGCCDEGAQYFRHSGLCLFQTIEILNEVTSSAFSSFYQIEKIKNIAEYILHVHIADKYYVNFADCSPIAGRAGAREFLFGERINSPDLMLFAAQDYEANENRRTPEEISLYYRLQSIFTDAKIRSYAEEAKKSSAKVCYNDIYYPSVGLFIARDDTFCLAVKAGDNDDNHNHNDIGSMTIYKNGLPFLIDVGVENYTKKTFSNERYEIWTMQSSYHNLPECNEQMQRAGVDYKASDIKTRFAPEKASISMELSDAYPISNTCSYRRNISFNKNSHIQLIDTWNTEIKTVMLFFMSYEKPVIDGAKIFIGTIGAMETIGAKEINVETIPITDSRLQTAWKHDIYRICIVPEGNTFTFTIKQ